MLGKARVYVLFVQNSLTLCRDDVNVKIVHTPFRLKLWNWKKICMVSNNWNCATFGSSRKYSKQY